MELAPFLYDAVQFLDKHLFYLLIPIPLVFNTIYLCRRERGQRIGMAGWGNASRNEQPLFFYFLWFLHIAVTVIFTLLFAGYLMGFSESE